MSRITFVIFETIMVTIIVYMLLEWMIAHNISPLIIAILTATASKLMFYIIPGGIR